MTNCKYKLRKLSVGLVSVGTMLIAPTVLGQEVSASSSTESSTTTANTGTGTASGMTATTPSATTDTGEAAGSGARSEANGASSVVSSEESQSSGTTPASPQAQTAPAATSTSSVSSSNEKTPKTATTTTSSTPVASTSNNSNKVTSTEAETQTVDVERYTVDKENSKLNIKDGKTPKTRSSVNKDTKLIRNRDDKQRDIVDVTRTVETNEDGLLMFTGNGLKPKQIDEGADVMALLDVSQKMTKENFDKAKEQIKKMVTTLTGEPTDGKENHNRRNSVRLMTFYRKVNEPIELTAENVDKTLDEVWKKAKEDWDWGVDLQGAIHKAREIFNKEKEKKSGKRQHIVLFSQGESTFSYDIKNKMILQKLPITEKVTTSSPLFPWLPIFNHTNRKAEIIGDLEKVLDMAEKVGISLPSSLKSAVKVLGLTNSAIGSILGKGLTEYLGLTEYSSDNLDGGGFDYSKRVGEGYYYHSLSDRKYENTMPLEEAIRTALASNFPKLTDNWFFDILNSFVNKDTVEKAKLDVIMKVLNSIFYKKEYRYYNHNLSAIAEAKMAQQEGITFYSVDVTDLNSASKRVRRQAAVRKGTKEENKKNEEERNTKFDTYLKKMSEGNNFLSNVEERDFFKDTLTELTIKDEFTDKVTVEKDSWSKSITDGLKNSNNNNVKHQQANTSTWSFFSSSKESLTWIISKEALKETFEKNGSLTFKYKLRVNKDKLLDLDKKETKRDTSTENKTSVTANIISNTVNYKINNQEVKGNKLDAVNLTYTKETVPVPDVEGEVVPIPEKPLVEPMTPLYPAIPNYPTPQLPKDEDLEISGGHGPIVDIVEDTGAGVEGGAQNGVVSTQENKDPIVDITEDTQPGMSGSNDATVVEEDTAPKRPDVLVGGQSDPIDITEDTQPGMSGSNDATVIEEDTAPKRPDVLVGGQCDPIDITEDTQPGMSGSNDATVIEDDTKPKRFFHFDNEPQAPEKPKEQPSLSLPQAPVYKAAHHLPASGDKREASFTIVALTIIGAAGLLSKKRRDTEEN
uniref:Serum opacity factor n=1 Tax=Streptococcus pyogenes TaxID=1314 RepID=Q9X3R6_STRPY|nr:serum opacity factor [Streptococcus pyogenes]